MVPVNESDDQSRCDREAKKDERPKCMPFSPPPRRRQRFWRRILSVVYMNCSSEFYVFVYENVVLDMIDGK